MRVTVSSTFNAPAERVWQLLQKTSTLQYIAAGMVHYQVSESFPVLWRVGEQVNLRPKLFNRFDQGDYFVTFTDIDDFAMCMETKEQSDSISSWKHRMRVHELSFDECVYIDEIDINAGLQTWLVGGFAHLFYRHRHRRWQQLLAET